MNLKEVFKAKVEGVEKEFAVKRPSPEIMDEATIIENRAFRRLWKVEGLLSRDELEEEEIRRGVWTKEKTDELVNLQKIIDDGEKALNSGNLKLSEAKKIALNMSKARMQLRSLLSERNKKDERTADALAANEKFNFLLVKCLVYNDTGEPYYKSVEEFKKAPADDVSWQGAATLAKMLYGVDDTFEHQLPENKFLIEYGFVDDKLRLINENGDYVDEDGQLVDEYGRRINEDGTLLDYNGNELNEDGSYKVEFKPFLDDDGNPVQPKSGKLTGHTDGLDNKVDV